MMLLVCEGKSYEIYKNFFSARFNKILTHLRHYDYDCSIPSGFKAFYGSATKS